MSDHVIGIYGKVPAHGDFIDRSLPSSFINTWDDWLQRSVASSKELLRDAWLDYYLTSPIWRFILSPGTVDAKMRAGVLLPSVDSVGRYFPLTITSTLPASVNAFAYLNDQNDWFAQMETAALAALQDMLSVDDLLSRLQALAPPAHAVQQTLHQSDGFITGTAVPTGVEQATPSLCYNQLLQQLILARGNSFSLWWSNGSDHLNPTFLAAPGLPNAQGYTALLDGQWEQWGWKI